MWDAIKSEAMNSAKQFAGDMFDSDPTLATASPAEANIRNRLAFSTLRFTFPTTATETRLSFPAYLTSFNESYSPQFQATPVFGRADAIPVYQNTDRTITLAFEIPNYDRDDANENMKKLNMLIKSLYPGYLEVGANPLTDAGGQVVLATPPLTRIKFANLLINHTNPYKGLLGYINSFSTDFQFNQRGVLMDSSTIPGREALFPRVLSFSIGFKPLHESTIGWDMSKKGGEFFGGRDYPYRTKLSLGDVSQAGMSALGAGTGEKVQFKEILGWTG